MPMHNLALWFISLWRHRRFVDQPARRGPTRRFNLDVLTFIFKDWRLANRLIGEFITMTAASGHCRRAFTARGNDVVI